MLLTMFHAFCVFGPPGTRERYELLLLFSNYAAFDHVEEAPECVHREILQIVFTHGLGSNEIMSVVKDLTFVAEGRSLVPLGEF